MGVAVNSVREHGGHVVGFYDDEHELIPAVAAFFADRLDADGTAIVVATDDHRRALEAYLATQGYSMTALTGAGRYRSFDATEMLDAFVVDDRLDPLRFAATVGAVLDLAVGAGEPVYLFGEMVALLFERGQIEAALELEALWNELATRYEFVLFCAYTMSSLEATGDLVAARRICDAHTDLVPLDTGDRNERANNPEFATGRVERLFVATPTVLRGVRRFVRAVLDDSAGDQLTSDVELVATELATNAVMHAHSPFRVSITCTPSQVRVAVRDTSFAVPEHVDPHADRIGGRGVGLVSAFSRAWGVESEPDGKTVWAEIAR